MSLVTVVWLFEVGRTSEMYNCEVMCFAPSRALLCNNFWQIVHTTVPPSPSSIIWYRCKTWEENGRLL